MNAHIITGLNSGLGDMYSNIYRVYDVQQQLKNLGYTVYVYIDFTRNPYKVNSPDRSVFHKVFKFIYSKLIFIFQISYLNNYRFIYIISI